MKNVVKYSSAVLLTGALAACAAGCSATGAKDAAGSDAEIEKNTIVADDAPEALGPYSHARTVGNMVYLSGQIGLDPKTGELAEGIEAQTKQAMDNIGAVLSSAGLDYSDILKTTVYVADLADFTTVNEIYGSYFGEGPYPARSCVQVAALPKGALVEIEATASK